MRTCSREPDIGREAVGEPPANVVACGSATMNHLMMASAAAQISRPARRARFLGMDMTLGQPFRLHRCVDAGFNCPHGAFRFVDKAMTGEVAAFSRNADITRPRTTRVRAVGSLVDLLERGQHV